MVTTRFIKSAISTALALTMSSRIRFIFTFGTILITTAAIIHADEVDGVYGDTPTCDNHGNRNATEELGDSSVFADDQQIAHAATFLETSACLSQDDLNIPNRVVEIINFTGRTWTDLYYVGDPSTVFSNVDGFADAGVFPGLVGLAFRIDSVGVNRPLIFESMAADNIFVPGEAWQFIVQDYSSPIGPPDSFTSIGFADASVAAIETSAASIVHFVPEPATAIVLVIGLLGLAMGRRH